MSDAEKKHSEGNDVGSVEPEFLKALPPEAEKIVEIGMSIQRGHKAFCCFSRRTW